MSTWMKHPNLDSVIEVPDAAVVGHRQSGWCVTDPPPPPEPEFEDDVAPGHAESVPGVELEAAVESRPDTTPARDGKEN